MPTLLHQCFNSPLCNRSCRKLPGKIECACGARYCSKSCQQEHWHRGHEKDCGLFGNGAIKRFDQQTQKLFKYANTNIAVASWLWECGMNARQSHGPRFVLVLRFESLDYLDKAVVAIGTHATAGISSALRALVSVEVKPWTTSWKDDPAWRIAHDYVTTLVQRKDPLSIVFVATHVAPGNDRAMGHFSLVGAPELVQEWAVNLSCDGATLSSRERLHRQIEHRFSLAGLVLADADPDLLRIVRLYVESGVPFQKDVALPVGDTMVPFKIFAEIPMTTEDIDNTEKEDEKASPGVELTLQEIRVPDLQAAMKRIVLAAAGNADRLLEVGKRCADLHGRGAFVIRFASPTAANAGCASTLEDSIQNAFECTLEGAMKAGCPSRKLHRKQISSRFKMCAQGILGELVSFLPLQILLEQPISEEGVEMLQNYDVDTAVCVYAEVSLSDDFDVFTNVNAVIFDVPSAGARATWKKTVRAQAVNNGGGLPGDFTADLSSLDSGDDPSLNPLTAAVVNLLSPIHIVRPKLVDDQLRMWYVMELVTPINKFLMKEAASPSGRARYQILVDQGDRRALLREGMIRNQQVMTAQIRLWNMFGGAAAYNAKLDEDVAMRAGDRQERARRAVASGILHICAACGDRSAAVKMKCSRCGRVRYCDAECQRRHWKEHKLDCGKV